jgi:hypothetical protein
MQQDKASDRIEYRKNHSIMILVKVIIALIASIGSFALLQFVTPYGGLRRLACLFVFWSIFIFIKKRKGFISPPFAKNNTNKISIILIILISFIFILLSSFVYQANKSVHVVNRLNWV